MMNSIFGSPGAMCMAAAIMISTFGCDNGLILSGARVYFAMARDRLFLQKVATTNRYHVPAAALVAQGIWTAVLTLPRTVTTNAATHEVSYGNVYTQLLEYIISADLLFYVLMIVALIILRRKKPSAERPYRTWGYPLVPVLSILLAGLLIIDLAFLGWLANYRSCFSRACDFRNGNLDRANRRPSLFFVANACRILRNPIRFRLTKYWDACKIEETTDGRGCGACRQARETF